MLMGGVVVRGTKPAPMMKPTYETRKPVIRAGQGGVSELTLCGIWIAKILLMDFMLDTSVPSRGLDGRIGNEWPMINGGMNESHQRRNGGRAHLHRRVCVLLWSCPNRSEYIHGGALRMGL